MASVEEDPDLALSADALSALQGFLSDRGVEVSETPGAIRDGIAGLLAAGAIGTAYEDSSDEEGGEDGESSARKAPKIAFDRYVRKDADHCASLAQPRVLDLGLVDEHHSLWGHKLWNASLVLADMMDAGELDVRGKTTLELGAGAALPSLVAALNGAAKVVATDYAIPSDTVLVDNVRDNLMRYQVGGEKAVAWGSRAAGDGAEEDAKEGGGGWRGVPEGVMHAEGHTWGYPCGDMLAHVGGEEADDLSGLPSAGFDVVFMADLVFNRSEHEKLLMTLARTLAADGVAYVTYSHHDPSKRDLDMNFFTLAAEPGERGRPAFQVEQVRMWQMTDIFLEHDGLDDIRGQVMLATLRR